MSNKYICVNGTPVKELDLLKWAKWFEKDRKHFAVRTKVGAYQVSTVFLGIDHSFGDGPPVLWETMVFGIGPFNQEQDRCCGNAEQAEAMHKRMVERCKKEA